jgi:uncharacterized protein (TIGR02271 family)
MNQTLVAAFESHEAAERAATELARLGFDKSEIQIQATRASARRADTDASDDRDTGILASIRRFFAELFGDDDEGYAGSYTEAVRRGGAVLTVVADDTRLDVARESLTAAGAIDIDERVTAWRNQGWSGDESAAARSDEQATAGSDRLSAAPIGRARERSGSEGEAVLPVLKEELEIGKRRVSGGAVRVVSRVVSQPVSESVELRREEAVVERRPVDREASAADANAFRERTIEVEEMAERPVVHKTARVVEEVVVGKRVSTETERIEDTVRSTEVDVERVDGGGVAGAVAGGRRDFADIEDEFRSDYRTNFASSGASYDDLRPAYRGGYEMRSDSRFADRDWDDVEPELRRRWESDNPGSAWERVKAAVRRGWERATA